MSSGYYRSTIKSGSNGDDVTKWQKYLYDQGYYTGDINGVFDDVLDGATKQWQLDNGIGNDGIVGDTTWGKAGFKNYNLLTTPTDNPNLAYTPYGDTTEGAAKKTAVDEALSAFNSYAPHSWVNEETYNELLEKKLGREDFSYNLNADALYKQYAEQYRSMGKLAMEDTMGRAAAMTGGYGNSYAATVGNQAYQAYLGELNDVIPELYQMALQKYTMEGEQIDSNLAALGEDYNKSLGEWQNKYGMLKDKYDVLNSDYINSATLYDSEQDSLNGIALKNAEWAEDIRQSELDQYWKENGSGQIPYSNNPPNTEDDGEIDMSKVDMSKIDAFSAKIGPEWAHDTIARKMYGPYTAYVAVEIANDNSLTDDEKMYLISKYGITASDIQYARDKGYDID